MAPNFRGVFATGQRAATRKKTKIQTYKMKQIQSLVGAMILMTGATSSFALPIEVDAIVGKWRHIKMVQTADGKVVRIQESHGASTMDFRRDGTWSLSSSTNASSGSYRLVGEDSLETTILKSDVSSQVGWTSVKKVSVDEEHLQLITTYDEKGMEAFAKRTNGTRPTAMDVTSTFEKIR